MFFKVSGLEWLSIGINGVLVIWVASLQIKASQNKESNENYDPVVRLKEVSKKLSDTIKPFIISALLTIASCIALYYEVLNEEPISRFDIFKISLLASFFFANIVLMICTWHRSKGYTLATKLVTELTYAFRGDRG